MTDSSEDSSLPPRPAGGARAAEEPLVVPGRDLDKSRQRRRETKVVRNASLRCVAVRMAPNWDGFAGSSDLRLVRLTSVVPFVPSL